MPVTVNGAPIETFRFPGGECRISIGKIPVTEQTLPPVYRLTKECTLSELPHVYEIIIGCALDQKSFRRRMSAVDVLEKSENMRSEGKRPAKLYRAKASHESHYLSRTIEA